MESKQVQEWMAQAVAEVLLEVLAARFGPDLPDDLVRSIEPIRDRARLDTWIEIAAVAKSLEAFRHAAGL